MPVQYELERATPSSCSRARRSTRRSTSLSSYELQVCNLRTWDVNNQCPVYDLHHVLDGAGKTVASRPTKSSVSTRTPTSA